MSTLAIENYKGASAKIMLIGERTQRHFYNRWASEYERNHDPLKDSSWLGRNLAHFNQLKSRGKNMVCREHINKVIGPRQIHPQSWREVC
jgi:hypothetical protein